MELTGTIAIVTGATGGLGGSVVASLLEAGATVAVPFRSNNQLDDLYARHQISPNAPFDGALVDLTDENAVIRYCQSIAQQHGRIDALINAAGGFGGGQPVHKTPWSIWQQQLDINLKTAVLACGAAIPHMIEHGGSIVNVSTRTAMQSGANLSAYASSKRAVLQLTEALADELCPHHITVNSVLPSVIDTPANRAANPDADYSAWVKPEAIARVIRFLIGPDARIISGAHIPVYGEV